MIYNSISEVCSIIFVPNLTVQLLEFDKNLCYWCENATQTSHIFHNHDNGGMVLISLDFTLRARLVHSFPNDRKVKNDVFLILIYEFNIYLLFQKEGEVVIGEGTS